MANQNSYEPDLPLKAAPADGSLLPPPYFERDQASLAVPTVLVPSSVKEVAQAVGMNVAKETLPHSAATSFLTILLYILVKVLGRKFSLTS